jgi:uncharacterized protein
MTMRVNARRAWHRLHGRDRWNVNSTELTIASPDGVSLAVSRLGSRKKRAIVVAHSLLGYRTKPTWMRLSEALTREFTVYAVDLRGHGDSSGECSGGPLEALDVYAAVTRARADGFEWVGTVGGSLGGAAVLFEAATSKASDLVCAISPPAKWLKDTLGTPAKDGGALSARLIQLFNSRGSQAAVAFAFGVQMSRRWAGNEAPIEVAHRIAPTPLMIVHDEHDHLFPGSSIRELMHRAGDPKQLWMIDGFGHCEDGFTPQFCYWLTDQLARAADQGLDSEQVEQRLERPA